MALDELQKPNIGKPEFATGRSTGERKMWAIVTTVAFAIFWFAGLFLAAGAVRTADPELDHGGAGRDRVGRGPLRASQGRRGLIIQHERRVAWWADVHRAIGMRDASGRGI